MESANRYRRAPGVVIHWHGGQAVCFLWQTALQFPISVEAIRILDRLSEWVTAGDLAGELAGGNEPAVVEIIDLLHSLRLIEREDEPATGDGWLAWSPAAAFYHFATKNGSFPEDLAEPERQLVEKAKHDPPPAPTKRIDGARIRLPETALSSPDLARALATRRTWRNFSEQPVPAAALGTLLNLTFGVQARGHVAGQGPIVLRTSPSGGSRHPIEAYVLAWNVDGVKAGVYHYDSDARELVDLRTPISAGDIPPLLAQQTYFAAAGAAVILCPVFARSMWRYAHSRAYRAVLIDAGHLGQTFCLVATALGLAPFTTMAFSEEKLEGVLGLDGVRECPLYVAGVGMPDPGAREAPGRLR